MYVFHWINFVKLCMVMHSYNTRSWEMKERRSKILGHFGEFKASLDYMRPYLGKWILCNIYLKYYYYLCKVFCVYNIRSTAIIAINRLLQRERNLKEWCLFLFSNLKYHLYKNYYYIWCVHVSISAHILWHTYRGQRTTFHCRFQIQNSGQQVFKDKHFYPLNHLTCRSPCF